MSSRAREEVRQEAEGSRMRDEAAVRDFVGGM